MKPPFIQRSPHSSMHSREERGVTIILVALAMIGILALAALSIDVVTLYLARSEAQRAADSAALAGARIISLSGVTGDPANSPVGSPSVFPWPTICTLATQVAKSVANLNAVGGAAPSTVTVTYLYNGATEDCTAPSASFAVNPQVQVQVQRTSLPTFFARIWRRTGNTVNATATAEAFNPSGSSTLLGTVTPVQPRCVKPLFIPNLDPWNQPPTAGKYCNQAGGGTCQSLAGKINGSITNPGISLTGSGTNGVIGETFKLFADCGTGPCGPADNPLKANVTGGSYNGSVAPTPLPNLEYLPGQVPSTSNAVASCGDDSSFQKAIAGCDQTTVYQCGVANANTIDVSVNPGGNAGDTAVATQCLIHQAAQGPAPTDADSLDTTAFPFKIKAGTSNPLTSVQGNVVSSSTSIVSLPIYDSNPTPLTFNGINQASVTVVGFLQVFINYVDTDGSLSVTVLNVAGCGNGTSPTGNAVSGSSPVPVRLITPPSS